MSYGTILVNWTGGYPGRGYFEERRWAGGNASSAEKANGNLKPHRYSKNILRINSPRVKARIATTEGSKPFEADAYSFFTFPPEHGDLWTSNHWNALISKLYAEVKGGDFNASVATAQLGESLGSITNAATRIYRAYRYARKGRLRSAAIALTGANKRRLSNWAASKEIARNWLELQYGWLPLLEDAYSATELLASYLHRPITRKFRVRKQVQRNLPGLRYGGVTYRTFKVRHRHQIIAYLEEDVSGYATLGLTDPLTVAWELVPYSFVLDWFLPIGPWLEASAAARTMKGTFVITSIDHHLVEGIGPGSIYDVQGGGSFLYEWFRMDRDVSTALTARLPSFKPLAQVGSDLRRCLNALALLENLRR